MFLKYVLIVLSFLAGMLFCYACFEFTATYHKEVITDTIDYHDQSDGPKPGVWNTKDRPVPALMIAFFDAALLLGFTLVVAYNKLGEV